MQSLLMLLALWLIAIILGWKLRGYSIWRSLRRDQSWKIAGPLYSALGNKDLASLCSEVAAKDRENYALTLLTVVGEDGCLPNTPDHLDAVLVEAKRRYEEEDLQHREEVKHGISH